MKLYLVMVSFLVLALYSSGQDKKISFDERLQSAKNESEVFLVKIRNLGTKKILPKYEIELKKLVENEFILWALCSKIDSLEATSFLENPNLRHVAKRTYFKLKIHVLKKRWRNNLQCFQFTFLVGKLLKLGDKALNDDIFKFFKNQ